MPKTAIIFGIATTLLTPIAILINGGLGHATLYIPMAFGIALVVCGAIGMKEGARKHAMHAAAMVGLIGAIAGLVQGCVAIGQLASDVVNWLAMSMTLAMGLILATFVFLCIQSFRAARKAREAAESTTST